MATLKLKSDTFSEELTFIKDERIRNNAIIILNLLPDYFYEAAATSSGKYHPQFAQGQKGLVRHTKVAVRIAKEILDLEFSTNNFNTIEKDLVLMSLLIHDGLKSGLEHSGHTCFEHPIIIADFILDNKDKLSLEANEIKFLVEALKSHMGQWNRSEYSNTVLPKPETKSQRLVHMCDYLASRKFLNVNFDGNNNIIC